MSGCDRILAPMSNPTKTTQLQIRVSAEAKRAIARAARRAGMDMSSYVLERVVGAQDARVVELLRRLADDQAQARRYALAELHDLLAALGADELRRAVTAPPPVPLPPEVANLIEYACAKRVIEAPAWTRAIVPLVTPVFGSQLQSLRLHLLAHSPPPFRRRNIFIDTSIGGRV
jgi:uncharacterized protein (DUF1778 family)